jgi:hypothetical protein
MLSHKKHRLLGYTTSQLVLTTSIPQSLLLSTLDRLPNNVLLDILDTLIRTQNQLTPKA